MFNLNKIAEVTGGELLGEGSFEIGSIAAKPEKAETDQLALIFDLPRAKKLLPLCGATAIVLPNAVKEKYLDFLGENKAPKHFIFTDRPRFSLSQINDLFKPNRSKVEPGVHPTAIIDPNAEVDPTAAIGPFVTVGAKSKIGANTKIHPRVTIASEVTVGEDCTFYSGVVIEDQTEIGSRVIVHANTVIGADGYSYVTKEPSNLEKLKSGDYNLSFDRQILNKIESAGNVIIRDDVEIGSNTSIDRGTIGPTFIDEGTKIDNQVQIAHNVRIGKDCLIIAKTGIAGSAIIGDRVTMAGASGCGDGVELGHDVVLGAFSAANSNVDPLLPVLGAPAIPYGEFMKRQRALVKIVKSQKELKELKAKVEELEAKQESKQDAARA